MTQKQQHQFEILRRLALAGSKGEELRPTIEQALQMAARLVDLEAAAIYLWDKNMDVSLAVTHAASEDAGTRLNSIEKTLFSRLRQDEELVSAYMTFGGDPPAQSFSLALRHGQQIFGAIIGIQPGESGLVSEDIFLEALSAAIAINIVASGAGDNPSLHRSEIDRERLSAIIETAVTVNHEINNPLTAILGNIQLLLLNHKEIDKEIADKLRTMESSAMKIKDVTQRLLRVNSARTVEYSEGTSMLDLSGTESDDKQNDKEN